MTNKGVYFVPTISVNESINTTQKLLDQTKKWQVTFWTFDSIQDIRKLRYLHEDNSLELFFNYGKTALIAFESSKERDETSNQIEKSLVIRVDYESNNQIKKIWVFSSSNNITQQWIQRKISNFEYLMHLNSLAGRCLNDLAQYPVFPWILKDYESKELKLDEASTFRDLSKPMGAQTEKRLEGFINTYKELNMQKKTLTSKPMDLLSKIFQEPYFYGSHYSNSATIIHYLMRLEPFTTFARELQGGKFDNPDRCFKEVKSSWELTSERTPDTKELIPEFFFLPEFLKNVNGVDFGKTSYGDKQTISEVILPTWAESKPRNFIKVHRDALESEYVSRNLNHWIDLIFGYKQKGEEAVKSFNLFHPLTYQGTVQLNEIKHENDFNSIVAQIDNYGQVPKQLFTFQHPSRNQIEKPINLVTSKKLYCHTIWEVFTTTKINKIYFLYNNSPYILPENCTLVPLDVNREEKSYTYLRWDHFHKMRIYNTENMPVSVYFDHGKFSRDYERIICCDAAPNGVILAATSSGIIKVWKKIYQEEEEENGSNDIPLKDSISKQLEVSSEYKYLLIDILSGHSRSITTIHVSYEFKIFVTASKDKTCIIWDLNKFYCVKSLEVFEEIVQEIRVSSISGDILTLIHTKTPPKDYCSKVMTSTNRVKSFFSLLQLFSINGNLEEQLLIENKKITCFEFTNLSTGTNHIIAGTNEGEIMIFDSFNLTHITTLTIPKKEPIVSICIILHSTQFLVATPSCIFQYYTKIKTKGPRDNDPTNISNEMQKNSIY